MKAGQQAQCQALFITAGAFAIGGLLALILAVQKVYESPNTSESLFNEHHLEYTSSSGLTEGERKRVWMLALDELILHSNKEADISHLGYKFDACFLSSDECVVNTRAFWDEFNKVTFYYAPSSMTKQKNHATFYILLKEGAMPRIMMRLVYVGKEWAYIEKASILVNGEFILKEKLPETRVQREAISGNLVYEFGDLIMDDNIEVIRKIVNAQTMAIRIEGGAIAALDREEIENVKLQAKEILLMNELITQAIEKALSLAR